MIRSIVCPIAVVYPYVSPKSYPYLKLHFGDVVQILEENGGKKARIAGVVSVLGWILTWL